MNYLATFTPKAMRRLTLSVFFIPLFINLILPILSPAIEGEIRSNAIIRDCILFVTNSVLYFVFYCSLIPNILSCKQAQKRAWAYLSTWAVATLLFYIAKMLTYISIDSTNTLNYFFIVLEITERISLLGFFVLLFRKAIPVYKTPCLFVMVSCTISFAKIVAYYSVPGLYENGMLFGLWSALGGMICWIFYYKLYRASKKHEKVLQSNI